MKPAAENLFANPTTRAVAVFAALAAALMVVGAVQSWSVALVILQLCLISAVMALGVNIQWGYAGLFNVGIVGFAALGGLAPVLISKMPVAAAWAAGGNNLTAAAVVVLATVVAALVAKWKLPRRFRGWGIGLIIIGGILAARYFYLPATAAIEAVDPAKAGYLGGLGWPVVVAWLAGGLFAAAAAYLIGKVALGLRSDYLAIATLGIAEIILAVLKNEEWLTRGVKNVTKLPRPVPVEIELQNAQWLQNWVARWHADAPAELTQQLLIDYAGIIVKLSYVGLLAAVLAVILGLSMLALNSPWGRMMRAIRDNERAAAALGKNITARHMQVFIIGSAVVGLAGAMLVTLDGQFTPAGYQPLRYTFLIWVMVIVGGSGNNLGAVAGGFLVWFVWVEAEPAGRWLMDFATIWLGDWHPLRRHLLANAQHMRLFLMGIVLLLVMRFTPGGLLPEARRRGE